MDTFELKKEQEKLSSRVILQDDKNTIKTITLKKLNIWLKKCILFALPKIPILITEEIY